MGVQKLDHPGNVLTSGQTLPAPQRPGPALPCWPLASVQEAGVGEGKTNELQRKRVRGLPSTAGLSSITHQLRALLPFAKDVLEWWVHRCS